MTDFYQDQTVVVLGGAGFVGKHLCTALKKRGADVVVIDNLSRHDVIQKFSGQDLGNWHKLDITRSSSRATLTTVMDHINPFAVLNLAAAVAGVEYNQKHHNQMFLDNVQLQTIPVMICERLGVPHFLQVSSACVYGADANAPAIEGNLGGEPVGANAGYSWAKRMGERAVLWSNLSHAVIVRPSNIYGPGDWYDEQAHVIPKLIKGYDEGTAKIFAGKTSVRQFIYVEDVAKGMLHALEYCADKAAYNLAPIDDCNKPTDALSMYHLHHLIAEITGKELAPCVAASFDPGDGKRYSDGSKMSRLGWYCCKTPFDEGLEKTIEAYLER